MHHFIFPTKTAWVSSGSNLVTGVTQTDQNFGQDEILELKKFYYNNSLDHVTRALVQFDLTEVSKSIENLQSTNNQITPNVSDGVGSKFFLRLYEAEGNKDLSQEYTLIAHPLSQSWDEGVGKFGDVTKVTHGVSRIYRQNKN